MVSPRVRTSAGRVAKLGTGRPRPKQVHRPRPPQLPTAHHRAHDGQRLMCGKPYGGAVLTDPTTHQVPEGYRLCGTCHRHT